MSEIEFSTRPQVSEEFVMLRLSQIVRGHVAGYPTQKDTGSWVLDPGNNWFGLKLAEGQYRLSYRYHAPLEDLKSFLEYLFK